ncbi:hypothetical protein [Streptomyces davaonensis]|uniref:hypothetical protein n=1 Tax=Streptomyces davaonensis TaxID=348043 RepID=UPI0012FFB406|nr:hypothetical protein [Streptomyces davaonensis]
MNDDVIKAGVASDADYIGRLFRDFQAANDAGASSITPLCMASYLALILHEAKRKPQAINPSAFDGFSAEAEEVCARARHSLKLFEDTRRHIDGQLQFFRDEILDKHSDHFLGNTWLWFAQKWEKDLGLFTYEGTLVSTSHTAAFHLGVETKKLLQEDNGAYMLGIMQQLGRCFLALGARLDTQGGKTFVHHLSGADVRAVDVRASTYYAQAFNGGATLAINGVLTDFQVRMNFIDKMITAGADIRNLEYTVFKIRYVTLYQVLLSLKILKEDPRYPLSPSSTIALETILDSDAVHVITDSAVREFRNTLMHYNLLRGADTTKVDLTQPIFGLVPQYFPAYDFQQLSCLVDTCIRETASALNEWASSV